MLCRLAKAPFNERVKKINIAIYRMLIYLIHQYINFVIRRFIP